MSSSRINSPSHSSNMNILQWNLRSIRANMNHLQVILQQYKIDIALLSETWIAPSSQVNIAGYSTVRDDRNDGYGGTAILIRHSLPFQPFNIVNHSNNILQICGIKIGSATNTVSIVSFYARPQHNLRTSDWDRIFNQFRGHCIIGGDCNVHHTALGSHFTDRLGNELLDSLESNQLIFLNNGSSTMIPSPARRPSAPDITIVTPSLAPKCSWTTLDLSAGSDHLCILTQFNNFSNVNISNSSSKSGYIVSKANWPLYRSTIDFEISKNPPCNYAEFIHIIKYAASISIPYRSDNNNPTGLTKTNHPKNFWWDDECRLAWLANKTNYNLYKRFPTFDNFIKVKRSTAFCTRIFKKKKKSRWIAFCESLNRDSSISEIWTKVKKLSNGLTETPTLSTSGDTSWLNEFLDTLAPPTAQQLVDNSIISIDNNPLNLPFSFKELVTAIKSSKNVAPGPDEIHYVMLNELSLSAKSSLLQIINNIWINNLSISEWSSQIIRPILKPGKPSCEAASYRPIALSSCVAKTFERMVKKRLDWWLEYNKKIPAYNHGFRKSHSTIDALSTFVTDVHLNFSQNNILMTSFLDINNAFNHVNISLLVKYMVNMNVPGRITLAVLNLLKARSIQVRFNCSTSPLRNIYNGLPQGAVLSPVLFNIYTSSLNSIISHETKIIQFADDITLYTSHPTFVEAEQCLSAAITRFNDWAFNSGFTISENKSAVMVFTRKRNITPVGPVRLGPYNIKIVNSFKLLGLHIDRKLLWRDHIQHLLGTCESILNLLRCLNKIKYGAHPSISLMIYRALILSRLDYGSQLYGDAARCHTLKLDKLQNKALRSCLGAMTSTPIDALQVEARMMPLKFRRDIITGNFLSNRIMLNSTSLPLMDNLRNLSSFVHSNRYWTHKKTPLLINHFMKLSYLSLAAPKLEYQPFFNVTFIPSFDIEKYIIPDPSTIVDWSQFPDFVEAAANLGYSTQATSLYTDGSKALLGVGAAFYHPSENYFKKIRLPYITSIFTAEATAILQALEYTATNRFTKTIIFSDSQSVLHSIHNILSSNNSLISAIYNKIYTMNQINRQVFLIWVKGHCGNIHNEAVDAFAKDAIENGTRSDDIVEASDLKAHLKLHYIKKWQMEYKANQRIKGKYYGSIQPSIPVKPWFHGYNSSRNFFTTINRLRLNHNRLPVHLQKIKILESGKCSCDEDEDADANHVILGCPLYNLQRDELFAAIAKCNIPLPTSMQILLSHSNKPHLLQSIYKFIYSNKITI